MTIVNSPSRWNPFAPTKRDIEKTEYLARKNLMVLVSAVAILVSPIILTAYLNRGTNFLKILGYLCIISIVINIASYSDRASDRRDSWQLLVSLGGNIAICTENVMAVTLARKRLRASLSGERE